MELDRAFWHGKRVFVTGHTGFKGSWLCLWLRLMGAQVTGYALPAANSPSLFADLRLERDMRSIEGDVRDAASLAAALSEAGPEVVFHLAAQSLVRPGYSDPVGTYATNVMGTVHLLDAVRRHPGRVAAVVNVTTDKCYENHEWVWGYRESDRLGGRDPYSNSKAGAELVTAAYRQSFFEPGSDARQAAIASARAGNVIGGGDWAIDRLVPDTVRAFRERRAVASRHPDAVRPWQHVLEPLAGYLLLGQRLAEHGQAFGEAWNFGPSDSDAKPVRWILERMASLWGDGAAWQADADRHLHEAQMLRLDCSKAHARLGWAPRWSLDVALQQVVAWYVTHAAGGDMREFTIRQIAEYESARAV